MALSGQPGPARQGQKRRLRKVARQSLALIDESYSCGIEAEGEVLSFVLFTSRERREGRWLSVVPWRQAVFGACFRTVTLWTRPGG